jgi:hypothetical protein
MSSGETAYLAMVVLAMLMFVATLAWVQKH